MTLNFPHMHQDLLSAAQRQALPAGVLFLDPGLGPAGGEGFLVPELAPFDRRLAKAILADTLRFGESVANPRDIATHGLLQQVQALNPESARLVEAEVERSITGGVAKAACEDPVLEARRQAQTLLLLAWNLEERLLDLRRIGQGLSESWSRLGASVAAPEERETVLGAADAGDDDGEPDSDALAVGNVLSGLTLPEAEAESLPWRRILEAFAVLVPGRELVTADAAVIDALREAGVPESGGGFAAPAWRMAGLDRCPAARPWLDVPVRLVIAAPAVEAA